MRKPIEGEHWYFVDETGDPVFYDRRGNLIVGQEGCSPILALGFIETADPVSIRRALADLHAQIARALLAGQPERLARLGLEGARAKAFGEWLAQTRQFYREAANDTALQATLAEGGLTAAVLAAGQNTLDAAAQADSAQESAKGLAQQATQDRDAAAAAFQEWMGRFWKIAAVGLAGQPQWMERLGHKVRS